MTEKSLTEQIIKKLQLHDDPRILEKATEFLRLLELKSSKIVAIVGDYGKTVICIDLAASMFGAQFELNDGIKASGLRKSIYINYRKIFEKILDLNKPIEINEICLRLNLNDLTKKANEILTLYKNSIDDNLNEIDLSHPQYPCMAVYQASKLMKKKIPKVKIIPFSHLKSAQWAKLEQQWDKLIQSSNLMDIGLKRKNIAVKDESPKMIKQNVQEKNSNLPDIKGNDEVEDYECWKKRMLYFARLQVQTEEEEAINKENKLN